MVASQLERREFVLMQLCHVVTELLQRHEVLRLREKLCRYEGVLVQYVEKTVLGQDV